MVGMLVINALLKKFTSRVLYIASGVYSVIINAVAFGIGTLYLTRGQPAALNILFLICLFATGLQFGASNLLPNMFQADILDGLELKTGRRLDASLPFLTYKLTDAQRERVHDEVLKKRGKLSAEQKQ